MKNLVMMTRQPDLDICSCCGDHTEFYCCDRAMDGKECDDSCESEYISGCCSASPCNTDPDFDMDR